MRILIINGPNLNLLGTREPHLYGNKNFEQILTEIREKFPYQIDCFQSNNEGELIDTIQHFILYNGFVLNLGAYSHYSYALADAVSCVSIPKVEVHISNIFARESFRHTSLIAPHCNGTITGLGTFGYTLAIQYLTEIQRLG